MTRIIAGRAGGRRIAVPPSGTRPTSDRVREAFAGQDIELLFTNLSREQEEKLRAAFGE